MANIFRTDPPPVSIGEQLLGGAVKTIGGFVENYVRTDLLDRDVTIGGYSVFSGPSTPVNDNAVLFVAALAALFLLIRD